MPEHPDPREDPEAPAPRRLGFGMLAAAWCLVMVVLAVPFWSLLESRTNPNRDVAGVVRADGASEVTLRRNREGHYVAPGAIDGRAVTFMIDTGATVVSVPEALARDIGLRPGRPVMLETANGTRRAWTTRLEQVELGTITVRDVPAVINPGHATAEVLLGMSFLQHLDFSQHGRELTLRQPPAAR